MAQLCHASRAQRGKESEWQSRRSPSSRSSPAGCLDSTLYAVVDDPDKAVEIADWESAEARDEAIQSEAMGAFAPLFELLAAPFSATVVKQLH